MHGDAFRNDPEDKSHGARRLPQEHRNGQELCGQLSRTRGDLLAVRAVPPCGRSFVCSLCAVVNRLIVIAPPDVCTAAECVEAAAAVMQKLDWSVDPCDDFFRFSCAGWVRANPIPEDASTYGTYSHVRKQVDLKLKELLERGGDEHTELEAIRRAKVMYRSCMNESLIEDLDTAPLLQLLSHPMLRWPVLSSTVGCGDSSEGLAPCPHRQPSSEAASWDAGAFDLRETLAVLSRNFSHSILMSLHLGTDDKSSAHYILKFDQASLILPAREDYTTNSTQAVTHRQALLRLLVDIALMMGAESRTAHEDMAAILNFEVQLANILVPRENRTSEALYNRYTVAELQDLLPQFDWLRFMKAAIDTQERHPELNALNSSEPVLVGVPTYFQSLFELLGHTDTRVVANYVVGRLVMNRVRSLSQRFLQRHLQFHQVVIGTRSVQARWDLCVNLVEAMMPSAAGRLFVDAYFQEEKKELMEKLVDGIRWAFVDMLETENTWMDVPTKQKATDKADAVLARVGYPDYIKNNTYINEEVKMLRLREDDYFGNVLQLLQNMAQHDFHWLRRRVSKTEWYTNPTTVNAFYSATTNQILFPAGELQKPFFWGDKYPMSLSYGAIGVIVGHEFTHGFDSNGRKYDKHGNLHQWWSNASIAHFSEKAQCMIEQYNNYYWKEAQLPLKGKRTLGENIADSGGVREAFRAYRKWIKDSRGGQEEPLLPGLNLTHNQLFFISYAHVRCQAHRPGEARQMVLVGAHSPPEFRVLGSMSNFPEFSRAFHCAEGSTMNRGKQACRVW
ncbi:unnamed protein product [Lampetra fluviatilis]